MSKLTRKIFDLDLGCDGESNYQFCNQCRPIATRAMNELWAAVKLHNVEIRECAVREQLKADLAAVCPACAYHTALEATELSAPEELHSDACKRIRTAWAKMHRGETK